MVLLQNQYIREIKGVLPYVAKFLHYLNLLHNVRPSQSKFQCDFPAMVQVYSLLNSPKPTPPKYSQT